MKHIFQLVLARFAAAKSPGDSLVIDESIIPFRGRLKFKQYIPGKAYIIWHQSLQTVGIPTA